MNIHNVGLSLGLKSSMKINNSNYDTNITVDLKNLDLSLKTQYTQTDNLKLKILSFIEKFDLIDVTIPDQRLQEIWNLVMNTSMMQDFIVEDIFHHYFIKSLPEFDLTNLVTFSVNQKNIVLQINEIPKLVSDQTKKYLDVSVGLQEVSSIKGFYIQDLNSFYQNQYPIFKDLTSKRSKIETDSGNDDDSSQDIQVIANASLLSLLGKDILGQIDVNLSDIEAVKSFLTLKNLKIVFPSLAKFYSNDTDIINLNLVINVESKIIFLLIFR